MHKATPEPQKQAKLDKSIESQIRHNGELVEALYASEVYEEILFPLLSEGIASVSGRLTNGRYHHGDLTRSETGRGPFLAGYQKALMDYHNYLHDFVLAKDKLTQTKKQEEADKKAPIYNPFMEESNEEIQ